jgi:transposase-like protein
MTKFSADEKLQAVISYHNGSESLKTIAKSLGVHSSVFTNWIRQFEYHGEDAFKRSYTSYSIQDKLNVLNHMNEHGMSVRETAAVFNIASHSTILSWKNSLETHGIDALQPKKKGRPSMNKDPKEQKNQTLVEGSVEALQAEVERLRMENAYLKKLNALVQNKEKSPNKTKRKSSMN